MLNCFYAYFSLILTIMRIAVYGKSLNNYNSQPIQVLIHKLEEKGCELMIHEHFYSLIKDSIQINSLAGTFNEHVGCRL
jgi:hypothetical protein